MLRWEGRDQLSEGMRRMLALKAALWTNGNEQKLVERAIGAYAEQTNQLPESVTCSGCHRTLPVKPTTFTVSASKVTFHDVPLAYCDTCNTQTGSLFLMGALEEIAEQLEPGTVVSLTDLLSSDKIDSVL